MNRISYQLDLNQTTTWCMEKLHFHESVEILLSLSDGGMFYINNRNYEIKNGSLFLLKGAILHRSVSDARYKRYVLHISMEELEKLSTPQTDFVREIEKAPVHTILDDGTLAVLTEKLKLLEGKAGEEFGGDLMKNVQLIDVLVSIVRAVSEEGNENTEKNCNTGFSKVENVISYIQSHCEESLTLDHIAARFYVNKYHLCHIFKDATGLGVAEYVIKCRITKARDLLRRGHRVHEAGEMVGFHNNSHFIRTFRKMTGISPKSYADQYASAKLKEANEIFLETARNQPQLCCAR